MQKKLIPIGYAMFIVGLLFGLHKVFKSTDKGEQTATAILQNSSPDTTLVFQSGFEPNTRIINQTAADANIVGPDLALKTLNNWRENLENHPKIGYAAIQYQGGNPKQRLAEIGFDPQSMENRVLKFWLKAPNVDAGAGRVQMNLYGNREIRKMAYTCRMLIPGNLKRLRNARFGVKWLTLMEFWNNANWTGQKFPFRITVNLKKPALENRPFTIGVTAQVYENERRKWKEQPVWDYLDTSFEVPLDHWMEWEVLFVEGNRNTGRFRLSVTPEGGERTVIHDIRNYTYHPDDPHPDGLNHFNPMKLYTSAKVINYMAHDNNYLQVYWDDFKFYLIR